jgi:hypothetical protein
MKKYMRAPTIKKFDNQQAVDKQNTQKSMKQTNDDYLLPSSISSDDSFKSHKVSLQERDYRVETDSHNSYMTSEVQSKKDDIEKDETDFYYDATKPGTPFE